MSFIMNRKEIDSDEDPDFVERNRIWEDKLPPIFPQTDKRPWLSEDSQSLISVIQDAGSSTRELTFRMESDMLPSSLIARKRWKDAYHFVRKELVYIWKFRKHHFKLNARKRMALQKQARCSYVGTGAEMQGKALGLWGTSSLKRFKLFHFLYNQTTEYILLLLILFHLIILIIKASKRTTWSEHSITLQQVNVLDTLMTCIFTVECIARILCLGFCKGPKTYLRNTYNQIDFVAVLDSWIQLAIAGFNNNDSFFRFAVFRVFRALLSLHEFEFFANVLAVVEAVRKSVRPLEDVLLLATVLLFFYALIGLQFFGANLQYRCARKFDEQESYPPMFCAYRLGRGYICPEQQGMYCKQISNPNYGMTHFDNFPFSFLTLFTVITLEGWSQIMYDISDTEHSFSDAYFITLVVIISYFLVNIIIAAISGIFLRVRQEHQALLKKSGSSVTLSFYNATVLASILKDAIKQKNTQLTFRELFQLKSKQVKEKLEKAMSGSFKKSNSFERTSSQYTYSSEVGSEHMHESSRSTGVLLSQKFSLSLSRGAKYAWETISSKCSHFVKSNLFRYLELFAVSGNLLVQCIYFQGMSRSVQYTIYTFESLFLILFAAFMIVRLLAFGLIDFLDDKMNILDITVIVISAGAVILRTYPNVSVIRILRWFYNDKKLGKQHESIVADCFKGLGALSALSFFFFLVILIFAVIGMEMYAGEFSSFQNGYPRANFDNIFSAMLVFFTVTTGEMWVDNMWNSLRPEVKNGWFSVFMYCFYFIITVYVVLNLIIAAILEKTELTDNQKKKIQKEEYLRALKWKQSQLLSSNRTGTWVLGAVESAHAGVRSLLNTVQTRKRTTVKTITIPSSSMPTISPRENLQQSTISENQQLKSNQAYSVNIITHRASQILKGTGFCPGIVEQRYPGTVLRQSVTSLVNLEACSAIAFAVKSNQSNGTNTTEDEETRASFELAEYEELNRTYSSGKRTPWYLADRPLLIIPTESFLRTFCIQIHDSKLFKSFTFSVVVLSIVVVMLMKPSGYTVIDKANFFIFAVFLLEFIIKVVGFGFLLTPDPYLGDIYNFVDMFLLIIDGLFLYHWSPMTGMRSIRILVALRPLRLIYQLDPVKKLSTNLIRTMPAVASLLGFTFAIFSIFAIIGVQVFRGRFYRCTDNYVSHHSYCTGTYMSQTGILASRVWVNPAFHFDNYPSAMLSLFVCSTFDNWVEQFLYPAMDVNGIRGNQPARNKSPLNAFFFIVFVCIGGFFILRMFVGVFIDQFGVMSGSNLLTERQKLWRDTNRVIQKMQPVRVPQIPRNHIRVYFHRLVTHPFYPQVIRGLVLINYTWLSTHFAKQPKELTYYRNAIETFFASFYFLEALVKIFGYEVRDLMVDYWNIFEICNATASMACIMPENLSLRKTIGRIFMGARIFRVIRYTPRLNRLLRIAIISMSHMLDTMGLLAIFLVAFAGMGVQLFAFVRDGRCINHDINFKSFLSAFVVLFQVTTADDWSCIMADARISYPWCTQGESPYSSDCGLPWVSVLFFVLFSTLSSQIFMNLFVAGIIDTITFGLLKEKTIITTDNLAEYQHLWTCPAFDSDANGFIGIYKLHSFLTHLGAPLGRRHHTPPIWYVRIYWEALNLHNDGKGIPFRDLLETLTLYKIGSKGLEIAVRIEREKHIHAAYKYGASISIQSSVRGFLERRRLKRRLPSYRREFLHW